MCCSLVWKCSMTSFTDCTTHWQEVFMSWILFGPNCAYNCSRFFEFQFNGIFFHQKCMNNNVLRIHFIEISRWLYLIECTKQEAPVMVSSKQTKIRQKNVDYFYSMHNVWKLNNVQWWWLVHWFHSFYIFINIFDMCSNRHIWFGLLYVVNSPSFKIENCLYKWIKYTEQQSHFFSPVQKNVDIVCMLKWNKIEMSTIM